MLRILGSVQTDWSFSESMAMPQFQRPRSSVLPSSSDSRLSHARLRQPTRLPTAVASTAVGRYLNRLRWLFGGY